MSSQFSTGTRYRVFENVLSTAQLTQAQSMFRSADLKPTTSSIDESTDGPAMRGPFERHVLPALAAHADNTWQSALGRYILASFREFEVDKVERAVLTVTPWAYPAGSRLSWHNDSGAGRLGAFVFFVHQHWEAGWGGALGIVDDDLGPTANEQTVMHAPVLPTLIWPVPNRLVVFRSNTQHGILRVDPTAGTLLRETFTGFVIDEDEMLADAHRGRP